MSGRTPRFGLNWFNGDDQEGSLADDGSKFTGTDRLLLDRLLSAIEQHTHGADDTSDDAPDNPTLGYASTGGALEAGLTYYYKVTFVDSNNLESDPSDEVSVALPAQLDAPDSPGPETGTSGSLTPGLYYYALTAVRGSEESALGDPVPVTLRTDEHQVTLTMPALGSATSFRVWRMSDAEGFWRKFASSATTTFVDNGGATPVATDAPVANSGVSTYAVTVTLSTPDATTIQDASVLGWRIYRSTTSGTYGGNALVHYVTERADDLDPTSARLSTWTDTGDALLSGAPPASASKMHFAELTGGGTSNARGSWDSTVTDYVLNDVVVRNGSAYRALQAVPVNQDPANNGPAPVTGTVGATTGTSGGAYGASYAAESFTVGASDIEVSTFYITQGAGYSPGTVFAGIATAIGSTPAGVSWLTGAGPISVSLAGTSGEVAVTLTTPVTLTAGTTYYVVALQNATFGASRWAFTTSLAGVSGGIASVGALRYQNSSGGSWFTASGNGLLWRLEGAVPQPMYWEPQAATIKGAYSSSLTYVIGEIVQYGTKLWRSLVNNNKAHTPAAGAYWAEVVDLGSGATGPTGATGATGPVGATGPSGGGGGGGSSLLGLWSPLTTYAADEVVQWKTALWKSIAGSNLAHEPVLNPVTGTGEWLTDGPVRYGTATETSEQMNFSANVWLYAVQIWLNTGVGGRLTVKIRQTSRTGTVLAARTVDIATTGSAGFHTVYFNKAVALPTGTDYHLQTSGLAVGSVQFDHAAGASGLMDFFDTLYEDSGSGYAAVSGGYDLLAITMYDTVAPYWNPVAFVVPVGGTTGQALKKTSDADGDYGWTT